MLSIARRTAAGVAVLLVMPLVVWCSGWMWQPGQNAMWLKTLYWITETVTQPWDHHACSSLRLVPVVPAFSSSRSAGVICYPRRGHSGGSGRKILG